MTGGLETLGRLGTTLTAGRFDSGAASTTGVGPGFSIPSIARSGARVACRGLGFLAGSSDLAGSGGATLDETGGGCTGGRIGAAGRTVRCCGSTGGRNPPIGGRNDLPGLATGIDGLTDAAAVRTLRRIRGLRTLRARLRNGNSNSGKGGGGSARLRSLILLRTLFAVSSSKELE